MRKTSRKHLTGLICCLIIMNMMIAPVAHASLIPLSDTKHQTDTVHHNCDNEPVSLHLEAADKHQAHHGTVSGPECDHGNLCKMFCSVSASSPYSGNSFLAEFEKSNRWEPIDIPSIKSSFVSRLERPPKL